MTELLTESFCERCGTRYTFESAGPRKSRLGRMRMLSKGVRNFVLSDDSSFSEAMAEARSEEELSAIAHQLDAFHQTFNFCLTCRQYTCGDCWNAGVGRCLTCAPIPGMELPRAVEPEPALALPAEVSPAWAAAPDAVTEPVRDEGSWPESDLPASRLTRALGMDGAGRDAPAASAAEREAVPADRGDTVDVAPGVAVEAEALVEPALPEPPAPPHGLQPGQRIEDAVAAYEAELDAAEAADDVVAAPEPEAEPVVAAAPEPEPEPEPVVAAPEPEPEPVVAAVPEPVAAAEHVDIVPQPAWPTPSTPPAAPSTPWLTVAPEDQGAEPQWPTPAWTLTTTRRDVPTTLAGRPLLPHGDASALWAASAREVLTGQAAVETPDAPPAPTAQPCVSCGLSLSANARFCRRCGARQG